MRRTIALRLTLLPLLAAAALAKAEPPCEMQPAPDGIDEVPEGFDDGDCVPEGPGDLAYLIVPQLHASFGGFGGYLFTSAS